MIIGTGSDLLDIRRFERVLARYEARFVARCFTPIEREKAQRRRGGGLYANTLAKRFAAKEAMSKALGTGFSHGVFHKDMGVVNDAAGRPTMVLTGGAAARLAAMVPAGKTPVIHLTLTDEPPYAFAQVMIEAV